MKIIACQNRHTHLCDYSYQRKLISSQGNFSVEVFKKSPTNNPVILLGDDPYCPAREYLLEPEEARKLAIQLIEIAKECENTRAKDETR